MYADRRVAALTLAVAAVVTVAWLVPPSAGQEGRGFLAANGRVSFRLYCASCHGEEGKGNGSVAKFLTIEPADLTRIEERYGEWPEERLRAIIDGRQAVRAHGRREMPIWGDVFQSPLADDEPTGESSEERVERKIDELLVFLETIQIREDDP